MDTTAKLAFSIPLILLGVALCLYALTVSKQALQRRYQSHWADMIKREHTVPEEWCNMGRTICLLGWGVTGIGFDILFLQYFPWTWIASFVCIVLLSETEAHLLGFHHKFSSRDFIVYRELYEILERRRD